MPQHPHKPIHKNRRYTRWRWQIFSVTWLMYAGYYFTRKAFSVAKLGIEEDPTFLMSRELMGNLDAFYLTAYAIGQFVWGISSDKFGTRKIVLVGSMVSVGVAIIMGVSPLVWLLVAMMTIQGICQSSGWSPLTKNVGTWFTTHERGRIMGFWATNYAFGGAVATPFIGWIAYGLFDNWRYAFFAGAAVLGTVWILFFLLQRNKPEDVGLPSIEAYYGEPEDVIRKNESPEEEQEGSWKTIGAVFQNPAVIMLGVTYFLVKPARYAILFWGPIMVKDRVSNSTDFLASTIPSAFEIAGLIGPIVIGFISDKVFHARRFPVCAIFLFSLSIILFFFGPITRTGNPWFMLGILFLIGFFLYGPDSMMAGSAAVDFGTKKGAGSAAGFINGCGSLGAILGGWLPGQLQNWLPAGADHTAVLFYGFAGATFIAALLTLPFWNRLPAHAQTSYAGALPTRGRGRLTGSRRRYHEGIRRRPD